MWKQRLLCNQLFVCFQTWSKEKEEELSKSEEEEEQRSDHESIMSIENLIIGEEHNSTFKKTQILHKDVFVTEGQQHLNEDEFFALFFNSDTSDTNSTPA